MDFDVLIGTDEISIHALREEGDLVIFFLFLLLPISIHALREEGDYAGMAQQLRGTQYFYPRPPRGGRPPNSSFVNSSIAYFYPRPPRGGRLPLFRQNDTKAKFLSTPSARRATIFYFVTQVF